LIEEIEIRACQETGCPYYIACEATINDGHLRQHRRLIHDDVHRSIHVICVSRDNNRFWANLATGEAFPTESAETIRGCV